jgi:1,4-alpha-glucan branching enzyme
MRSSSRSAGELALVLHTHMPYVEGGAAWPPDDYDAFLRNPDGFGTWPFGEEWLWEAIATCYLPLLDVLGRAPVTLSLTPVLCDQLEAPGAMARCLRFLREIRPESHRRDAQAFRDRGEERLAAETERSAAEYAAAADRLAELGAGLLAALGAHATWTSAATHAVLPLLATDTGAAVQVQTGIASHRRRFGDWSGGFWLPECAHAPWLDPLLEEVGVRATCVELTRVFGLGDLRHLSPLASQDGPVLWPVDRQAMGLVWSEGGYPAAGAYRDYHALTAYHHHVWRNDGGPYDAEAARALVQVHARDFVVRVRRRVQDGGVCVCALDTELLGHWWYEGVEWLGAVLQEAARQGLALTTLDDALGRYEPVPAPADLGVTTWGEGGDLRTWSGPAVADLAWEARTAELRLLGRSQRPGDRALRELLALQASDWAFLVSRRLAGDYPRERARAHAQTLQRAMAGDMDLQAQLRNLAPELAGWAP